MICRSCGAEQAPDANFCSFCGQKLDAAVPDRPAKQKPKKRETPSGKANGPHILLRLLFLLCAAILTVHTLGTLAVGICGESTRPTKVSLSFSKKEPNGGRNDFLWTLDYHFTANGKDYSSFTTWHGTRWSPDGGYGKYHVNYLSFFPQISRFQKYYPLRNPKDAEDILLGGGLTLLSTAIGGVAAYFLLCLSFPSLPFFGLGRKKAKKKRVSARADRK